MISPLRHSVADVVINGRFLSQSTTGVQRYAREIVQGIDRLLSTRSATTTPRLELLVPPNARVAHYPLRNISIRYVGQRKGVTWEQFDLPWFARGRLLLSLANSGPILHRRQIVSLHDAAVHAVPQFYSRKFKSWYRLLHGRLAHSRKLVSVSTFAVGELERYYRVVPGTTAIVSNAGQHILEVAPREDILARHGLLPGEYVFAFGSHDRSKNAALVERAVELLPDPRPTLVVAGRVTDAVFAAAAAPSQFSTVHVGPVADDELRALYKNAMCFVLPSFYEGFGIPALEAMACGCPVIAADAASLPEVCGTAALYCDPMSAHDLAGQIHTLQSNPARREEMRRRGHSRALKFSWDDSAERIFDLLCEELGTHKASEAPAGRLLTVGTI
jgi:glycosyltransferase involved in cell wall biosynthesis